MVPSTVVSAPLFSLGAEKETGKVRQDSEAAFVRKHDLTILPTTPAGADVVASLNESEVVVMRERWYSGPDESTWREVF